MTFTDTFLEERDSIPIFVPDKKEKRMEIVTIEAQTFLEMNRALEALAKKSAGNMRGKFPEYG